MDPLNKLFGEAWASYTGRAGEWFRVVIVPAAIIAVGGFVGGFLGFVLIMLGWLGSFVANIALINIFGRGSSAKEAIGAGFGLLAPAVVLSITLAVVVWGGMVMLIVPGIMLAISLSFSIYILVLENVRGLEALSLSREYVRGRWWAVLGRELLVGILSAVVAGALVAMTLAIFGKQGGNAIYTLIFAFFTPFSVAYQYHMYENLVRLSPTAKERAAGVKKTFFIVCIVLGILAVIAGIILLGMGLSYMASLPTAQPPYEQPAGYNGFVPL